MEMLYDSDAFVVVHLRANEPDGLVPHDPYESPRHGFEIVDKRSNKEVYLDGKWAEIFRRQIDAWQTKKPTREEVEEKLELYSTLAQLPLVIH